MKQSDLFKNAKFISMASDCPSVCFRGKFLADAAAKTEITICGLGFFRLYINGKPASDDWFAPVTSHYHAQENCYCTVEYGEEMKSRVYAVKYDISSLVMNGENEIKVEVGLGWYGEYGKRPVLCYMIESGGHVSVSDENVLCADGPLTYYSIHLGEKQDYTKNTFDALGFPTDSDAWKHAVAVELPETEYFVQDCPNDRIIRSLEPKKLYEKDGFAVYDIDENIAGTYVFRCTEKGKTVAVTVSENLVEGEFDEDRSHKQFAEFVTDGTDREYKLLFTWQAFRYVKIPVCADLLRVDVIHTAVAVTSSFKCENGVLNWIYDAFVRTQLSNMHAGIPSDCPHIERRGYTGDGELTCEAVMTTLDVKKFYLKWMEDISDCQDIRSGHVQYTAPYFRCGGGPGGWGCAIVEVPYTFYKMYGDVAPMKKYYPQMLRYFDYLDAHSENDLVTSDQPGLWCLGEWCVPGDKRFIKPAIPVPFVNNYFYVHSIDRILELADLIGCVGDVPRLERTRKIKAEAMISNYYDSAMGDFARNVNSANVFALDIGLGDSRTLENAVKKVRTEPLDTGIFGTDLTAKVLFENGYFDDAVEFLSRETYPSFGFIKNRGATTLWEEWQNPRSMSHPMFGAVTKYLFTYILGIKRKGAGYGKITVAPRTNETTGDISGFITTEKGVISVATDRKNGVCRVRVPDGVDAEIIFDGKVIRE